MRSRTSVLPGDDGRAQLDDDPLGVGELAPVERRRGDHGAVGVVQLHGAGTAGRGRGAQLRRRGVVLDGPVLVDRDHLVGAHPAVQEGRDERGPRLGGGEPPRGEDSLWKGDKGKDKKYCNFAANRTFESLPLNTIDDNYFLKKSLT